MARPNWVMGVVAISLTGGPAWADDVANFYKGRTIDFYIGYAPGGGYDAYARLLARFLGKHIPGSPMTVPKNMAGGGGRVVSAWIAKAAPKDGTVLGTAEQSLALQQALGDTSIQFDVSALQWIGNPIVNNNVVVTWAATGVRSVEDARYRDVPMATSGGNTASEQYLLALNRVAQTRFKPVNGYPGANEASLAMERGEVAGQGSTGWSTWKFSRPAWLDDKKISVLVQIGPRAEADLPDVPLLTDLAVTEEDKDALRLLSAPVAIGRPVFTTPGTPPDRVAALRHAFDKVMSDPEFLVQAGKQGLEINPLNGIDLQNLVANIISGAPSAARRLSELIGSK